MTGNEEEDDAQNNALKFPTNQERREETAARGEKRGAREELCSNKDVNAPGIAPPLQLDM